MLIGVFTSFYPTRLIRAQLLALRDAEFVEAARMVGASNWRILRRHLLPHLVPTLLVWGAIAVATNILLEVGHQLHRRRRPGLDTDLGLAALDDLGDDLLAADVRREHYTPWQTILPTLAILLTVVSLNQISEGSAGRLEPGATR